MRVSKGLDKVAIEVRNLSNALLQGERNPDLFPAHIRRLRAIASAVRQERAHLGVNQDALNPEEFPLERATRVVYAIYDIRTPELFYLASRDPAGIDTHRLFLASRRQRGNALLDYLSKTDFSLLGVYPLESIDARGVPFRDGPARRFRFRLKPIKHDFGRVLCMADARTLRATSDEVLGLVGRGKHRRALPEDWAGPSSKVTSVTKTNAFWTVFSKRFKACLPILSVNDTVHVLKAFHAANKDTGVYVAAAPLMRYNIRHLDKDLLIDALHILSTRLKRNTQQDLFRAMADHVPNVLWAMKGKSYYGNVIYMRHAASDIAATLWHLSRARCTDRKLAAHMQAKFCDTMDALNDLERGTAVLAFARHGHSDKSLFTSITSQLSKRCSGESLFRAAWGMHMVGLDVQDLLRDRLVTCVEHVKNADSRSVEIWRRILGHSDCYDKVFGSRE
ncbi:uncharacterized protein BXIN_1150 [Babesia sp. Xinjiang]|uniref:uncharacterized protein n=1 Tax=Babesia sp. Xinjiang TaxID=462227 RepID=UPI000A240E57|nr:uncharacterized protein BXIN_1150 [Babesia sp. Xinjiang]ORM40139.1 hypothetical protein BXIN_1150 [Babesia sp. Xinjiang]